MDRYDEYAKYVISPQELRSQSVSELYDIFENAGIRYVWLDERALYYIASRKLYHYEGSGYHSIGMELLDTVKEGVTLHLKRIENNRMIEGYIHLGVDLLNRQNPSAQEILASKRVQLATASEIHAATLVDKIPAITTRTNDVESGRHGGWGAM